MVYICFHLLGVLYLMYFSIYSVFLQNMLYKESITMQSAQNIEKITFALEVINVIDKKQMCDSVIMGKKLLLLQPLRWRWVDCVIHHERDVCEE